MKLMCRSSKKMKRDLCCENWCVARQQPAWSGLGRNPSPRSISRNRPDALSFGILLTWKNLSHRCTKRLSRDSNEGQRESFPYRAPKFRSGKRNIKSSAKSRVITGIVRRVSRRDAKVSLPLFEIALVLVRVDHGQKAARFGKPCGFLLADIPAA